MKNESQERKPIEPKNHADFDTEWIPGHYLRDYYTVVEPDEIDTIKFFVDRMKNVVPDGPVLFFGTGPTLHHNFLAAPKASELHMVDYLSPNLEEIKKWQRREEGAHNWGPFVSYTLQCEGISSPTGEQVEERENMVRQKMTKFMQADAYDDDPLGEEMRGAYSLVFSPYCADSATDDKETWELFMKNITSLVKPGGTFITAALRNCKSYKVGDKLFPCADIDENDMAKLLEKLDFPAESTTIEYRELKGHEELGYNGIVLARATKNSM